MALFIRNLYSLVIVCMVCVSMLECAAQISTVNCQTRWYYDYCSNDGQINFYGINIGSVGKKYNISQKPLITLWISESNNTHVGGRIEYDTSNIPDGPYTVTIPSNESKDVMWTGTVLFWEMYGLKYAAGYYYKGIPKADEEVNNQSTNIINDGLAFTIYGKFDVGRDYNVLMYSPEMKQDSQLMPTCKTNNLTETSITCTIEKLSDQEKIAWRFLVQDVTNNNFVIMKNMLPSLTNINLTTQEPIPETFPLITDANSECVLNSANCVDGANITFNGIRFLKMEPTDYLINIEEVANSTCQVDHTTEISLTCTLKGINGVKGAKIITLEIKRDDGKWSPEKIIAGILISGKEDGSSGWTISYIDPEPDTNDIVLSNQKSSTVTTVLTIVFAIFFGIIVIVMLIICIRYKLITRKTWSTVKKQLQETQVEELRPRAAVHVKGELTNN